MQGPRCQADRDLYRKHMQAEILNTPNLKVVTGGAEDIDVNGNRVRGVILSKFFVVVGLIVLFCFFEFTSFK